LARIRNASAIPERHLSEERVTLSVGNRVLGALIASAFAVSASQLILTVSWKRPVAEVSGQSIAAYHLEGSHAAKQALNNEEYRSTASCTGISDTTA